MTELAILFGLIFMVVCIGFVALHSIRLGRQTLLDWALLGMAGVYGGGWALVAFVTNQGGNPMWSAWLLPFEKLYPIYTLCSLILAISIVIGWWIFGSRLRLQRQHDSLKPFNNIV